MPPLCRIRFLYLGLPNTRENVAGDVAHVADDVKQTSGGARNVADGVNNAADDVAHVADDVKQTSGALNNVAGGVADVADEVKDIACGVVS